MVVEVHVGDSKVYTNNTAIPRRTEGLVVVMVVARSVLLILLWTALTSSGSVVVVVLSFVVVQTVVVLLVRVVAVVVLLVVVGVVLLGCWSCWGCWGCCWGDCCVGRTTVLVREHALVELVVVLPPSPPPRTMPSVGH